MFENSFSQKWTIYGLFSGWTYLVVSTWDRRNNKAAMFWINADSFSLVVWKLLSEPYFSRQFEHRHTTCALHLGKVGEEKITENGWTWIYYFLPGLYIEKNKDKTKSRISKNICYQKSTSHLEPAPLLK